MVPGIILQFVSKSNLSSFSVFEFVDEARRRGHKVAKIRAEWVIVKSNENVRAKAGSRTTKGIIPGNNDGRIGPEGVEVMYPSSRLSMFVGENVGHLSLWVFGNAVSSSTGETISHRVVEEIVCVEV